MNSRNDGNSRMDNDIRNMELGQNDYDHWGGAAGIL